MRFTTWLLIGGTSLTLVGCSENDIIVKKQMEMEARLEQLVQGSAATNARLADISNELKELQGKMKGASADLEELKTGYREQKSSLETAVLKIDKVASEVPAPPTPKIEVVNRESAPNDKEAAPQDAYMQAFGIFSANRFTEAIAAFTAFIKAYPDHEYAANAQYWIGESYYTQKDYNRSLEAFSKVLSAYPKAKKTPDAMLKVGFSYISLNDQAKAKTVLQALIDKYPKSSAAAKARERLGRH